MLDVDEHDVSLGTDLEPADVVSHQCPRPADRCGVEDVECRHVVDRACNRPRDGECAPHLLEEIVGVGVRPDPEVDASTRIGTERVHGDAAAHEHGRAMGDRGARIAQERQVSAVVRPVQPWMVVEEDAMTDDGIAAERPE